MTTSNPIYETEITFAEIDRIIQKVYPQVAEEPGPVVIAALIAMTVMAMNPGAPGEVLIKQIEDISQFITMNIMTPSTTEGGPSVTLN